MLFAFFGLSMPELVALGGVCTLAVGTILVVVLLTRNKKPPRGPDERD